MSSRIVQIVILVCLGVPLLISCSINREYGYRPGADRPDDFPDWPPPEASSYYVLPRSVLSGTSTIGHAAEVLSNALNTRGYSDQGFYTTKDGGLAIVTRREQIGNDGSSLPDAERWSLNEAGPAAILYNSVKAQRSRLFVFLLTPVITGERAPNPITSHTASGWWREGRKGLPPDLAERPLGNAGWTAMIYEFSGGGTKPVIVLQNPIPGYVHLQKNGLLASLNVKS